MAEVPQWLRDLSASGLRARFGAATLLRARRILDVRHAADLHHDSEHISAEVLDGQLRFRVSVTHDGARLVTTCPCDGGRRCAHSAATVLAHLQLLDASTTPDWKPTLEALIAATQEVPESTPHPAPAPPAPPGSEPTGDGLAIRVERARGSWVSLRVLTPTDSGWEPRGLTWERLPFDYGDEYRADHKLALRAILATRANTHHQTLATIAVNELTPAFWDALSHAVEVGVQLLDGEHRPIRLTCFDAQLSLSRETDAILALSADLNPVTGSRGGLITLLGSPVHGVLQEDVEGWLIGGFRAEPGPLLRAFLIHGSPIRIPASEAATLSRYLPRLRTLGDLHVGDGIELPDAGRVRLVTTFAPSESPTAAAVSVVRFHYDDGADPVPVDAPMAAWRDPAAERRLLTQLPKAYLHDATLAPAEFRERLGFLDEAADLEYHLADGLQLPREAEVAPVISVSLDDNTDWFDLSVEVTVGGEQVPLGELLPALDAGAEHLMLASGTWFSLNHPGLDELRKLLTEAQGLAGDQPGSLRIGFEHASVWEELQELGVINRQSLRWQRAVGALLATDSLETAPPASLAATLRPYQEAGHAWLDLRWQAQLGGILADEMGLGKTLQALALLTGLVERGEVEHPALVVAPASVLGTWSSEAAKFAPELRVVVLTDTAKRRGIDVAQAVAGADLVVTSYTLLRLEADAYAELRFSTVLLDEAQFVKNRHSITYKAVRRLQAHTKFAMTGTPLENNLMDLWSLLSITSPGLFPDPQRFDEVYRKPVEAGEPGALAPLLRRIRPLVLRRTKDQVARELPPKQEQVVHVDLAPAHRRLYDQHLTAVRREVLGLVDDLVGNRFAILRSITRLRQLSLAPQLVDPESTVPATKLDALVDLVTATVAEGHRALIFSSFTTFLKLTEKRLAEAGLSSVYLDGSTRDRSERIERFRNGTDPLFLISLKAGGFGLTLTEADYVFILDPWWNPAVESQAIDRTHRIGQDKHVFVYRLVSEATIEAKVLAYQQQKRELFDAVVSENGRVAAPLTGEDIRNLLDL